MGTWRHLGKQPHHHNTWAMAASLGGCCSKLRIDGSARGVEVLVEEDVPMAVPADEELGVLEVLDAVHVAGRREEEVAVDQVLLPLS
ncbi:hypothetical protein OsJ_02138 [Oryza sativa Japonica Group]|uniref:Uncharacterized protein n=1 Tax=Oryza sativa subsp. japonica TaxID=39947 RepID=B9EXE8_ORYSJ|nr:hypothetical protein OsJ_02138 [Oryza sativa Japonica Group]